MQSKLIILSDPTPWSFTDEQTGQFRQGISAVCFLPFEGVCQKFSNIPGGCSKNTVYPCELGFKQKTNRNGQMDSGLVLNSLDVSKGKSIDWAVICK